MTQLPSDRSIQIWHPPPCPVPHCRGPNCNVTSLVIVLGCSPGHQELLSQVFQRHLQSLGEGAQSVSPHLQDNRTPRARHTETQFHTHTHGPAASTQTVISYFSNRLQCTLRAPDFPSQQIERCECLTNRCMLCVQLGQQDLGHVVDCSQLANDELVEGLAWSRRRFPRRLIKLVPQA